LAKKGRRTGETRPARVSFQTSLQNRLASTGHAWTGHAWAEHAWTEHAWTLVARLACRPLTGMTDSRFKIRDPRELGDDRQPLDGLRNKKQPDTRLRNTKPTGSEDKVHR